MRKVVFVILITVLGLCCSAQEFSFPTASCHGFKIISQRDNSISISHQIKSIRINDGKIILNNFNIYEENTPSLPSNSSYILIPNDSNPKIKLTSFKKKEIEDIELIHDSKNEFETSDLFKMSDTINIRGFNFIILNISPFHYDKDNNCLSVFYDINLEISYGTRNIAYGEDKYRDKEWDNILRDMALNNEMIDDFDYDRNVKNILENDLEGCQYLIVTPDNNGISQWADTLAKFRNEQGILTKVLSINEIGENLPMNIKNYFNDIYKNWALVPSAILLFGDYSLDKTQSITSFYLKDHPETNLSYLTDNKFVDFNNDDLPEICVARIPAATPEQAKLIVNKTIRYETQPSTNPDYYDKPITAMGFEESRWFQLCSEIIAGYFEKNGKNPSRLNAIYSGKPDSVWSTADNTDVIVNFFGPDGLDYIPSDLRHLTNWNADQNELTDAINKGTFLIQHRDHGQYQAWTNPYLSNMEINTLINDDLTFVMSANCRTGNFNYGEGDDDCFAERFLRVENGCVAIVAASETSYSFVNDTYVWGFYDYLWNDFIPSYGNNNNKLQYPAFANSSGKYFLKQSSWPYLDDNKKITYNLFHFFGDAFLKLNSEMPQTININYPKEIDSETTSFQITKNADVSLCLSVNGRIIALSTSDDSIININAQRSGTKIKVVATKQNHFRHEGYISVKSNLDSDALNIYPNPATDFVNIESIGIKRIDIYNNVGQKVKEIDNSEVSSEIIHLDCGSLKKGLFHLDVIYEDKRVCKALIVY